MFLHDKAPAAAGLAAFGFFPFDFAAGSGVFEKSRLRSYSRRSLLAIASRC